MAHRNLFCMPKLNNHENGDDEIFGQRNLKSRIFEHQVRNINAFHAKILGCA